MDNQINLLSATPLKPMGFHSYTIEAAAKSDTLKYLWWMQG